MNRRILVATIACASAFGGLMFIADATRAAEGKSTSRPNILWIMMDDCRADALGCYGRPWAKTPHMDAVAGRGVRFDVALVQNPVCVPSRSSMKASQYPHTLGIMAMGRPAPVPPPYLAETKRQFPSLLRCWKLSGIPPVNVGKIHAYRGDWDARGDVPANIVHNGKARTPELQKRINEWAAENPYPPVKTKTHGWQIGGAIPIKPEESRTWKLGDRAVAVLRELATAGEPFFLRVSFHAPHVACSVPPEYMIDPATIKLPLPSQAELNAKPRFEREALRVYAGGLDLTPKQIGIARGTYYGMVHLVDTQVGRLLEVLRKSGKLDDTIIAVNSDQGFQLGEHGLWKKRVLYEQNVRVPLVISCPKLLPQGKVIEEPVEMIDFLPTLLELSRLDVPDGIAGRSLLPLVAGQAKQWRPACFCDIDHARSMYKELRGSGRRVMVRSRTWKLVFFMDPRVAEADGCLYDLQRDPGETENLYGKPEYRQVVERLENAGRKWAGNR